MTSCLGEESRQTGRAKSSILHLGLLLWELFFVYKVTVTKEDEEDNKDEDETDSLFNALNREQISSQDSLFFNPLCLEIISNCLTLYSQAKVIDAAFRTKLYWDIVNLLIKSLEIYNPSRRKLTTTEEREAAPPPLHHFPSNTSFDQRHTLVTKPKLVKKAVLVNPAGSTVLPLGTIDKFPAPFTDAAFLGSHGKINDSNSWLDCFDRVNESLKAVTEQGTTPVKVAILDTGCDLDHAFFSRPGSR